MTDGTDTDLSSCATGACPYHHRISAICAWIVIVTAVTAIVLLNRVASERADAESREDSSPNVQLEITARYAVASSRLIPEHGGPVDPKLIYLQQLDTSAKSTPDHLRVAIVAGELSGASAALGRIDKLASKLRSPPLKADAAALRSIYAPGHSAISVEARQRLIGRYQWFGRLALAFGKSASDTDRRLAMQAATRAMLVIFGVGFIALCALAAGLVLAIIALVRFADGKIRLAYAPVATETVPFLEGFALYLALLIGLSALVGRFSGHLNLNATYLALGCVPVATGLLWPLLRGVSWPQLRYGLGWHLGTGLFREMCFGIVGYIAGLPLLAAGAVVTFVLTRLSGAQTSHPIVNQAAGLQSALRLFLLASVFAPLAEESLFRGALFHHLRHRHAWWISALVVSLIFAAMHPQGWAAIPPLAMIAVTFAAIREWRGTIVASATAHALNNGMITLVLVIATS
jgi:membrane protease YdiL (CAAX protease family)